MTAQAEIDDNSDHCFWWCDSTENERPTAEHSSVVKDQCLTNRRVRSRRTDSLSFLGGVRKGVRTHLPKGEGEKLLVPLYHRETESTKDEAYSRMGYYGRQTLRKSH